MTSGDANGATPVSVDDDADGVDPDCEMCGGGGEVERATRAGDGTATDPGYVSERCGCASGLRGRALWRAARREDYYDD